MQGDLFAEPLAPLFAFEWVARNRQGLDIWGVAEIRRPTRDAALEAARKLIEEFCADERWGLTLIEGPTDVATIIIPD